MVLSRSFMNYFILFWGPSTVLRAFLAFLKTQHSWKLVDLVLSRSFMSYCILFWGPSTVSRAFLAFLKTRGFGHFSQFYELLHTVSGSVDSSEGISNSHENSWIWYFHAVLLATTYCFGVRRPFWRAFLAFLKTSWFGPFSQFNELLHTVLGSVYSFEGISSSHEDSWIWYFHAILLATAYCFGVRRQFRGHFWHSWKLVDWVLSRSFISYCILFWSWQFRGHFWHS